MEKGKKKKNGDKLEYKLSGLAMFYAPTPSAHEFTGVTNSRDISFEDEPIFDESGGREQLINEEKKGDEPYISPDGK